MGRVWGYWTLGKLDILRNYLDAFTTASKSSPVRIYLDMFAGEAQNEEQDTGLKVEGSPRIALSIENPPFTHLRFFELPNKAYELESVLRADFPDRDFSVVSGDCNQEVTSVLNKLRHLAQAPTFAFVDPDGMQAEWRTLKALAAFRKSPQTKVELFLLCAVPMFTRLLRVNDGTVSPEAEGKIDAMYGCPDWREIYQARLSGRLSPSDARDEYLNLMRWRLETELRYKRTHPLEIKNVNGSPIYYMIFATDHEAGTRIMSHLFARAAAQFPAMREEAHRRREKARLDASGMLSLFSDEDNAALRTPVTEGEQYYEYEPPWRPWFISEE